MLTSSGRGSYQTSHCEKFGALRGPEADRAGARLCPQDQPQQDRMRGGVEPLQRASVCDGAAAGASPTVVVRPPERGWRHCKELTETPMLTPSGRGSYQTSHCEKFGALRGPEADRAGARLCPQDQPQQDRMRGGAEPLQRASVCDGAAAGASPTVAVRPPERGWRHCKELTETPMLNPSGRGSYQTSHCEKFGSQSHGGGAAIRAVPGTFPSPVQSRKRCRKAPRTRRLQSRRYWRRTR